MEGEVGTCSYQQKFGVCLQSLVEALVCDDTIKDMVYSPAYILPASSPRLCRYQCSFYFVVYRFALTWHGAEPKWVFDALRRRSILNNYSP